jgi:hypothetical protein
VPDGLTDKVGLGRLEREARQAHRPTVAPDLVLGYLDGLDEARVDIPPQ